MNHVLSLLVGWLLDLIFGDPVRLPHPVVWFGRMIASGEHRLNRGLHRKAKGAAMAVGLVLTVFAITCLLRQMLSSFSLFTIHYSLFHY